MRWVSALRWWVCWGLLASSVVLPLGHGQAQVMGERAEMDRLETRAENAISQGDAEGAAMASGRAALMAAQLARKQEHTTTAQMFQGAERLFRAQEQAYRAVALFERAGGEPPASSGVCGSVRLASLKITQAVELLSKGRSDLPLAEDAERAVRFESRAGEWVTTIQELRGEFECR